MTRTQQPPLSFGLHLQTLRMQKGISLETVSRETRISLDILRALEQEDYTSLPAEVYVKGFLRAYARTVGADGDALVQHYQQRLKRYHQAAEVSSDVTRLNGFYWGRLLLVCILFILLVFVSLWLFNRVGVRQVDIQFVPVEKTMVIAHADRFQQNIN